MDVQFEQAENLGRIENDHNNMTIKEIIKQPEGRRLEFKEILPESAYLANTIAFANDAGGESF